MTIISDPRDRRRLIQRAEGINQLILDCEHETDVGLLDRTITHHQATLLIEADAAFERARKAVSWALGHLNRL